MKTLSRLVFIFVFVGIAHAALIVPFWQQLEEPEEPKPKSPELNKLEELDRAAELEKSEELYGNPDPISTDLARKLHEIITSPFWKSLSHNEKEGMVQAMDRMVQVMASAAMQPPRFSPFGG